MLKQHSAQEGGFQSATSLLTKIYFLKERVLREQIDKGKNRSEIFFTEF